MNGNEEKPKRNSKIEYKQMRCTLHKRLLLNLSYNSCFLSFFFINNIILLSCAQRTQQNSVNKLSIHTKYGNFYYSKPIANQPLMRKCYDNIAEYWMNHMD